MTEEKTQIADGVASVLNAELDVLQHEQITDLTARLMKFYQVTDINDLVKAQCDHVERLQAKVPKRDLPFPVYQKVRFA